MRSVHSWLGRSVNRLDRPRIAIRSLTRSSKYRSYTYKSLQENSIRLLDLRPGCDVDPVQCALRTVALAEKPSYDSLSYCWGTKREVERIRCDNGTLPVTSNLLSALQHLRRKNTAKTLWIDAICVDQANIIERGKQVGMMTDIFQLSERTIVWLGVEGQNSKRAVELIRQLAKASQSHESGSWGPHVASKLPPLYDLAWSAFAALLTRPWWHRAWIVQETSVANNITFLCGDEAFSWLDLKQAVQYAVDLGFFVAYGGSATFQAFSLFQTRASFQGKQLPSLQHVLLQHRSFLATDPRDKVFGLLSLADPENVAAMGVKPDYHQSSHDLFCKVSTKLLKHNSLSALQGAGIHDKSSDSKLPSWVADWSVSDPSVPLNAFTSAEDGEKPSSTIPSFNASKSSEFTPIFNHDHKLLGLQGILIDQVEATGVLSRTRYLRHVSHMFELFVQCHDILEQLKNWELIALQKTYPTGQRPRDAYWQTLCAGRAPPNHRQDPRYKYYVMLRSLRRMVRLTVRWFPRSSQDTWYNRFFYKLFQTAWRVLGLTPTKIQRIGFPPESRLLNHRRMVRTKKGYIALVPRLTQEGDWIAICNGGELPLVVRKDGDFWVLVGESYMHGVMNGEAWVQEDSKEIWLK